MTDIMEQVSNSKIHLSSTPDEQHNSCVLYNNKKGSGEFYSLSNGDNVLDSAGFSMPDLSLNYRLERNIYSNPRETVLSKL